MRVFAARCCPCSPGTWATGPRWARSATGSVGHPTIPPAGSPIGWRPSWLLVAPGTPPRWARPIGRILFCFRLCTRNYKVLEMVSEISSPVQCRLCTDHVAYVGSRSAITRNMYRKHVRSLKNRFAIRMRRPARKRDKRYQWLYASCKLNDCDGRTVKSQLNGTNIA